MRYKLIDKQPYLAMADENSEHIFRYFHRDAEGYLAVTLDSIDLDGHGLTADGTPVICKNEFKFFERVEELEPVTEDFSRDLAERIYVSMLGNTTFEGATFTLIWDKAVKAAKAAK